MKTNYYYSTAVLIAAAASASTTSAFQSPSSTSPLFRSITHSNLGVATASTVSDSSSTLKEETPVVEQPKQEPNDAQNFDWFKSWYPIVPIEFLDVEKPHAFKLLGMDIVIWNDGPIDINPTFQSRKERSKGAKKTDGQWRAFIDQCPHRKVPLSEGRIEDDGSLFCSYHGWRFNGDGQTVDIPQIENSELEKIRANPKSNCNAFPVQIVDGVLWVWPDSSDDAKIESALSPIPINNFEGEDIPQDRVWYGTWNFRELPYGHDYFIENVVDPAHVPISHHNVVGSRYGDQSLKMDTKTSLTKDGFSIEVDNKVTNTKSTTAYTSPSQVLIRAPFGEEGARQYLELYSSPSRPGFSNHVGRMVIIKDKSNKMPNLLKTFTLPMPKWANHILASAFLHQDALFLHGQERSLTNYGQYRTAQPFDDSYADAVLPCSADRGVMLFRTWMVSSVLCALLITMSLRSCLLVN